MKKGLFVPILLVASLSLTVVNLVQAQSDTGRPQTTCPVIEGSQINKNIYTDYQGKRIYFCCPPCVNEFRRNPEKYLRKLESQGVKLQSVGGE